MNLKTLISIKFIIYIIAAISVIFIFKNFGDNFKKVEKQNTILLEQKKDYEKIIKLDSKDNQSKLRLTQKIAVTNSYLKDNSTENNLSIEQTTYLLVFCQIIFFYVFNYLNTRIEKLKREETDVQKQQML